MRPGASRPPGAPWRIPARQFLPQWVALAACVVSWTVAAPIASAAASQPSTWNFSQAQVPGAQALGHYGSGVTVAVVDTWVDSRQPDFGGRVVDEAYCVNQNGSCVDHRYAPDACVHGTHVAGTVASATYGVAPEARLLAVQVLSYDPSNGECSGSTTDVAAGIGWAVHHGAQVINLSLGDLIPGLFQSAPVTAAIHGAAAAGVVVVVAAGNDSLPLTDDYGGDALLVAATGPDGSLASYSDRGGSVALAAPGGDDGAVGLAACTPASCILSTEPHDQYGLLEGTSMAAPHVAGAAALLLAEDPTRGRTDVLTTLESTAQPLANAGHGRLDAAAALARRVPARPGPPPASQPPRTVAGRPASAVPVQQGPAREAARAAGARAAGRGPALAGRRSSRTSSARAPSAARLPADQKSHRSATVLWWGLVAGALLLAVAGGWWRYRLAGSDAA